MINWALVDTFLRKGTALVTFKKADGTIRVMECTLADYLLPEVKGTGRPTPDHLVLVYDLEKDAWRSFKRESVISVEIPETGEVFNG